ncbi:uncharacterized protein LOC124922348 [Impatiens glandulifera]|uniref:uncharacterized protein LOC124922348 n=1 Tax=Impatiens glandulifera TaxID=253017 RepID=UPI001FB0DE65|nr:uncharacterized protein LOC124922348 [Impatiens glandulifera]
MDCSVGSEMLVARRLRLSSGRATATSLLIPKRGVSRLLWVSSFNRRGRSSAAHAPSEVPKAQEVRKRISKDERKALMESYICKYRSMNGGKFPSVSAAKLEVGGSYYVVRQLLQEIEYGYKTSSSDMKNEKLVEQKKPSIIPKANGSELTKECKIKDQSKKIVNDDVLGDSTVQNVEYKATPNPTSSFSGVLPKKTLDTKPEVRIESVLLICFFGGLCVEKSQVLSF